MYDMNITEKLQNVISGVEGDDVIILVEGIYGIAYPSSKEYAVFYIVKDDVNFDMMSVKLQRGLLENLRGKNFFKCTIDEKFDLVDSVMYSNIKRQLGYYPMPMIKLCLYYDILEDYVEGDYIEMQGEYGLKINEGWDFVSLYKTYDDGCGLFTKKIDLEGVETILNVLGDDFLVNDEVSMYKRMYKIKDYFKKIN